MWLWSKGRVAYLPDFFEPKVLGCVPLPLLQVAAVTYWRELHFYWWLPIPSPQTLNPTPHLHNPRSHNTTVPFRCHRFMHPWGWSLCGVDIGAFMWALPLTLLLLRVRSAAAAELSFPQVQTRAQSASQEQKPRPLEWSFNVRSLEIDAHAFCRVTPFACTRWSICCITA